jgi:RNA polymerase sigma-70 factor, ECF subfamily
LSEHFTALAAEVSPALLNYLRRYVGNASLAEDLLQETLIRMEKGLAGFEQRSSLKTWAFAIASRVATDYFRKPENRLDIVDIDEAGEVPDAAPQIGERLVIAEMSACVRQVIDSLPVDYRTALVLHDLEGLSAEQVAGICGCSTALAKIRIYRARARLKQKLEHRCNFQRDVDGIFRCDSKT